MELNQRQGDIAVLFVLLAVMYLYGGLASFWSQSTESLRVFVLLAFMSSIFGLGCYLRKEMFYKLGVAFSMIGFVSMLFVFILVFTQTALSRYLLLVMVGTIAHILLFAYLLPLSEVQRGKLNAGAVKSKRRK